MKKILIVLAVVGLAACETTYRATDTGVVVVNDATLTSFSDQYPNAEFSGKIIEQVDFTKDSTYDVRAKGDLNIHGQKQTRIIRSKLIIKNGTITVESVFFIPLADHRITIPRIISEKIATEIEVRIHASMIPQVSNTADLHSQ